MSQESVKSVGRGEKRMKKSQNRIMIGNEEEKLKNKIKIQVKIKATSSRGIGKIKNKTRTENTREVLIDKKEKISNMSPEMKTDGGQTEREKIKGPTITESTLIVILENANSLATNRSSRIKQTTKEETPRPEEQEEWPATAISKATSDPTTKLITEHHRKATTKEITRQNQNANQKDNTEVIGLPEKPVTAMMKTGDDSIIIDLLKSYLKSQCRDSRIIII